MGLFSSNELCCVCNNKNGKYKVSDGVICRSCYKEYNNFYRESKPIQTTTVKEIKTVIDECEKNKEEFKKFNTTSRVGGYIEFDNNKKECLIPDGFNGRKINPKIFNYKDIVEYELIEDEKIIIQGGFDREKGIIYHGPDEIKAILKEKGDKKHWISSLKIKIALKNHLFDEIYILLINSHTDSNSPFFNVAYDGANEIICRLSKIVQSNI